MEVVFLPEAEKDLDFWVAAGNKQVLKKIAQLVDDIGRNHYQGIGKPEPLKYELTGAWSRRINREHRLVYEIDNEKIIVHSAKGHYK